MALSSCSDNGGSTSLGEDYGDAVVVTAEVAHMLSSRAYQADGTIVDGIYFLTYNTAANTQRAVAIVDFDKPETKGLGIVTTPENNELTWSMIGSGVGTPVFYLDNVPSDNYRGSAYDVRFTDEYNPFKAGLFDDEDGTNDLLWGTQQVMRGAKRIDFDLHHYMSRIRIEVTTDEEFALDNELDLTDATVNISSLIHSPESYNRADGSLIFAENPDYEPLVFVNPDEADLGWESIKTDDENANIKVYTTQDFVLPPQSLLDNENRPRLTITLSNGKSYSGILPHAMDVNPGTNESYPVTLAFLKEHILTIRTKITQDPPELSFMPVTVVEWVDKGNFTLEGHQAGIYTEAEFADLLSNYATYNEFQLARYGYITTVDGVEKWVFNIWNELTLENDRIAGGMKVVSGKKDYEFHFNRYTVHVEYVDDTIESLNGETGEAKLYNIVSGTN